MEKKKKFILIVIFEKQALTSFGEKTKNKNVSAYNFFFHHILIPRHLLCLLLSFSLREER